MDQSRLLLVDALELLISDGISITPEQFIKLRNSALSHNLTIFRDSLMRAIGYVAYANINKESARKILRKNKSPTYLYEWSEGRICLILDVFMVKNSRHDGVYQLRDFISKKRAFMFSRNNKVKFYFKNTVR